MLRRTNTVISLSPTQLSIAFAQAGRVRATERVGLDPGEWAESWEGGLHALDQPLRHLLARLSNPKIRDATVLYTSPGVVCRLEQHACGAEEARTRLISSMTRSAAGAGPVNATIIASDDRDGSLVSVGVGVTDSQSCLQSLYAWLSRSKVGVGSMVPRDAEIARLGTLAPAGVDDGVAVLYFDASSSVIALHKHGRPALARLTVIGYGSIVEVHARAADSADERTEDRWAPEARAMTPAFRDGIPIDAEAREGAGRELFHSLAPVLQRIGVEVKQTFRFAPSLTKPPSNLMICGPGAAIPGIAQALEASLDMHVAAEPGAARSNPADPFGDGTPELALATQRAERPALVPRVAREECERRSIGRSIVAGAALAAIFFGGVHIGIGQWTSSIRARAIEQTAEIERIEAARLERERVKARVETLRAAAGLIDEHAGARTDWTRALSQLPVFDTDIVGISEIGARRDAGVSSMTIVGVAHRDESTGRSADDVLSGYIGTLGGAETIRNASLERTARHTTPDGREGIRFEIAARLIRQDHRVRAIADAGEASP